MKKLLLSVIIVTFIAVGSNAQFFSAGLKAGGQACATAFTPDDGIEYSGIFGYHAGAFAKIKSPVKLGAKLEVLYSARGGDITSPAQNVGGFQVPESNSEFRASYIDIPILATFNFIKPLAIELGPQFSILSSGETTVSQSGQSTKFDYEPDNNMAIGFAVGLDLNLPKKLGAYLRYNMSFNSVTDVDQTTQIETKTDVTQSWIQLGLKYRLVEPI